MDPWVGNTFLTAGTGVTLTKPDTVTGGVTISASGGGVSGTTNVLAKFTSSTAIGNSEITDDGATYDFAVRGFDDSATFTAVSGATMRGINLRTNGTFPGLTQEDEGEAVRVGTRITGSAEGAGIGTFTSSPMGLFVNDGDYRAGVTSDGNFVVTANSELDPDDVATSIFTVVSVFQGSIPMPRMSTTQRDAIVTPTEGICVYNLTTHKLNFFNGSTWQVVTST